MPSKYFVGKKNLEIVKRILYVNPDAEFIFCAGDDKTDEDMFRALHVFPPNATGKIQFETPLSVILVDNNGVARVDVDLAIASDAIFVTSVVEYMLHLVREERASVLVGSETGNGEEAKKYMG